MPRGRFSTLRDDEAFDAFFSSESMTSIGKRLRVNYLTLKSRWIDLFGEDGYEKRNRRQRELAATKVSGSNHPGYGRKGKDSWCWKGDDYSSVIGGYVMIRAPEWWKGYKTESGRAYEHRVLYAWHHAMDDIPEGYDIHHVDENKLNNRIDNLEMLTRQEHMSLHDSLWKDRRVAPRRVDDGA